tara:strand:+ start:1601 stop:2089 length:489 start_codon:yes stop_codon:yes gene_type:complete
MEYRIIGADLREYGPVDLEEIREWINEGRADANTLVCEMDEKQWIQLRDLPMVAGDLPKPAPEISGGPVKNGDGTIQISYLLPAILCTIFCCLPFGIAGIVFAAQANSKVQQGDLNGAGVAASRAKLMCILSFVFGLLTIIYWFSSGEFQRLMDAMQETMPR